MLCTHSPLALLSATGTSQLFTATDLTPYRASKTGSGQGRRSFARTKRKTETKPSLQTPSIARNIGTDMNLNTLKDLATDLEQFEARVRERAAQDAAATPAGVSTKMNTGLSFYNSDLAEEDTNALGHLADPWSVVRVTAHVSAPVPASVFESSLDLDADTEHQLSDAGAACVAIARLGGGDQTAVFPTRYAVSWLPKPGVYELKLMKRSVSDFPSDALVVKRVIVPRKGAAATPWLLDHLVLPERVEFDLHRVLASMKPVHQAVFMAAISRPDIEHKLVAAALDRRPAAELASGEHTLNCGIRAAMMLLTMDMGRDEASLVRLACLLSDLGELAEPEQLPGSVSGDGVEENSMGSEANMRCAHPLTATYLGALIGRFEQLEPQDADDLRALLGREPFWPYRLGCKRGPLSAHPVDAVLSQMGCAMGDALSQARVKMARVRPAPVADGDDQPDLFTHAASQQGDVPSSGETMSASPESNADLDELEAQLRSTEDDLPEASSSGEGGEPAQDEDGEPGSNTLALISADPFHQLDDLRDELRLFDEVGDVPRPSLEWAAGMLDGDGCIAIVKQPFRTRRPIYRLIVSICQNCLQTLEHFRRCVGVDGVIYAVKRKLEHNKQVYNLNYSGPKALLVIRRLRAYLVRKRPEALVAISFCLNGQISQRFGRHGVPPEVEAVRVAHYLKLRALK